MGKIVDALKAEGLCENTVISFKGDHGYQLGEHGAWEKYTTWKDGTRIPMIIRDPSAKPGRSAALFESVGLFPTLVQLAGLAPVPSCAPGPTSKQPVLCTEGPLHGRLLFSPTRRATGRRPRSRSTRDRRQIQ